MIDSSSHGWSFLFWTIDIWYKILSNTCYIFPPLIFFHCFSRVATNFTFTSETSLILLLLKCLSSNATKKFTRENCETQTKRNIFWRQMRCSTGTLHFTQCPNFSTTSRLASVYFFSFLNWPLKLDCTFSWQHSGGSEQLFTPESWKFFPCK